MQWKSVIDVRVILKAIGFLSLEAIGIPGNFLILACFSHYRIFNGKFMPVDLILFKLSFINLIVVFIVGIQKSLPSVGMHNLFDQRVCNVIVFAYRLFRTMSICMTSLLSCYHWAVLAPTSGFWNNIKGRLTRNLSSIMMFLWFLNTIIPLFTTYAFSWELTPNSTVHVLNLDFCLVLLPSYSAFQIIGTMSLVRDLTFIVLMSIASLCIVIFLYRHRQRVKSIWRSDRNLKNMAETKATNAVLMLVFIYVFFFGLDNGIWLYTICASDGVSPGLSDARVFFGFCYCALSPIVIIATNKKVQLKLRSVGLRINPGNVETTISHQNS